jgi:hypothetical protein
VLSEIVEIEDCSEKPVSTFGSRSSIDQMNRLTRVTAPVDTEVRLYRENPTAISNRPRSTTPFASHTLLFSLSISLYHNTPHTPHYTSTYIYQPESERERKKRSSLARSNCAIEEAKQQQQKEKKRGDRVRSAKDECTRCADARKEIIAVRATL